MNSLKELYTHTSQPLGKRDLLPTSDFGFGHIICNGWWDITDTNRLKWCLWGWAGTVEEMLTVEQKTPRKSQNSLRGTLKSSQLRIDKEHICHIIVILLFIYLFIFYVCIYEQYIQCKCTYSHKVPSSSLRIFFMILLVKYTIPSCLCL